jgi:hypothetical protein
MTTIETILREIDELRDEVRQLRAEVEANNNNKKCRCDNDGK